MNGREASERHRFAAPIHGLGIALLLSSCSSMPLDFPKTASVAFDSPGSTTVGGIFEAEAKLHPGKSGFGIIPEGRNAFTSRVFLADAAEKTLDVQYFIWSKDTIGQMLASHIVQAAERGVRVRFLLDDMNFKDRDSAAAAVAAHPNIEVRIINPHRHRKHRIAEFGINFNRLNKRMHNKILVMDNAAVIVGGRNIANEYFGLSDKYNNRDLDIIAVGPIVREISKTFDEFWNTPASVPIEALVNETHDIEDFQRQMTLVRQQLAKRDDYPYPLDMDVKVIRSQLNEIKKKFVWAPGRVIYDTIESLRGNPGTTVWGELTEEFANAQKEVLIESAYFVVKDSGIELARAMTNRGTRLRVLTNSLASNNVLAAQAGHSKKRKKLLEAGVELYEFRPDAMAVLDSVGPYGKDAITTLHTKALVIDDEKAFVGSYNLDPRSADINSEIGILVESRVFARQVKDFLNEGVRLENAYRVIVDERGELRWETTVDGKPRSWSKDPESTWSQRFLSGFIELLPVESQL